jgi:hypothetical protein
MAGASPDNGIIGPLITTVIDAAIDGYRAD